MAVWVWHWVAPVFILIYVLTRTPFFLKRIGRKNLFPLLNVNSGMWIFLDDKLTIMTSISFGKSYIQRVDVIYKTISKQAESWLKQSKTRSCFPAQHIQLPQLSFFIFNKSNPCGTLHSLNNVNSAILLNITLQRVWRCKRNAQKNNKYFDTSPN